MKEGFWSKDWSAALVFSAAFVVLAYAVLPDRFGAFERYTYDIGVRANNRPPSDRVAVIAIDDHSIGAIGPYPWPRRVHARMLDRLRESGVRTVASAIHLTDSQDEPGLAALSELSTFLLQSPLTQTVPGEIEALERNLAEVEALHERLGIAPVPGEPATPARPAAPPPPGFGPPRDLNEAGSGSTLSSRYAAHLAALRDKLDTARSRLSADDSLAVAMRRQGATLLPMRFMPGPAQEDPQAPLPPYVGRFALKNLHGRVNAVAAGALPMPVISAERMPPPDLGEAAAGIGHLLFRPDTDGVVRKESLAVQYHDQVYPSLSLLAAASALNLEPEEIEVRLGEGVQLGEVTLETSPRLQRRTHFYGDVRGRPPFPVYSFLEVSQGTIRKDALKDKIVLIGSTVAGTGGSLATPVSASMPLVVVLAHSVSSILQGHHFVEPAWGGILRALALLLASAYLAFLLPALAPAIGVMVSAGLVATLLLTEFYLLSAGAVWVQLTVPALLLVAGHLFVKVRDAQTRQVRGGKRSGTVTADARPILSGPRGTQKPMLGRYQIEKELGKGAMGVVYLGRDPKIGRRVAIKTMALSADFATDDVDSVKERFFREAEAAGNLSHPHIVQIFEAGEDHDLAYIAMEFIQGHDLVRYTRPGALLPVRDVLHYMADAADALDYAHSRKVVHRDIKPANLMLVADSRTIKITDFGVARLTDASKARTGMVVGTPSYMSPEQLSGKKVDGRSDLFSLGVTAYQLLTGSLPFLAESMATLMFKIANEPQKPVTAVRADLPAALNGIIEKVLQKHYAARYARGGDFARDLRAVLATLV